MSWLPNPEETKRVELTAAMCIDCLRGRGTVDRQTFTANLRLIADDIDALPAAPLGRPAGDAAEAGGDQPCDE